MLVFFSSIRPSRRRWLVKKFIHRLNLILLVLPCRHSGPVPVIRLIEYQKLQWRDTREFRRDFRCPSCPSHRTPSHFVGIFWKSCRHVTKQLSSSVSLLSTNVSFSRLGTATVRLLREQFQVLRMVFTWRLQQFQIFPFCRNRCTTYRKVTAFAEIRQPSIKKIPHCSLDVLTCCECCLGKRNRHCLSGR